MQDASATQLSPPGNDIRQGVRALLTAAEGFHVLPSKTRSQIASSLVKISSTAALLAKEAGSPQPLASPHTLRPQVLAQLHSANDEFSSSAVDRIAPTTQNVLNAVSFPRFVGELITGVFKAMNDSNQQQLTSYVDLIRNVAATTEGFADANIGIAGARAWLAERFPSNFVVRGDDTDDFDDPSQMTEEERAEWQAERDENTRLELKPGASMPSDAALRTVLGSSAGNNLSSNNPESLVELARSSLARNRQQMLSTMVMMGMQRIVIDSGRMNASMRFHIDASNAASEDRGSRFDARHTSEAGGKLSVGPWGASAKIQNTIGYVSTEQTQTDAELNAELDMNSSVELIFRTDYVPLERLAGTGDVNRIRVNALNPNEEANLASTNRKERATQRATNRRERVSRLNKDLSSTNQPTAMTPLEVPNPPDSSNGEQGSEQINNNSTSTAGENSDNGASETNNQNTEQTSEPTNNNTTPAAGRNSDNAISGTNTQNPEQGATPTNN